MYRPGKWFTITVNPTPNGLQPPNQSLCNGATTLINSFQRCYEYCGLRKLDHSNPAIGLAASGIGHIAAFAGIKTVTHAITATITVTPALRSLCTGAAKTFTITVHLYSFSECRFRY
ncbi:MAG: hypothetical protein IPL50_05900 [Chitinophagaceae bacterium]|nr:hypothetical protein [Chitinophagaceae bacterium]